MLKFKIKCQSGFTLLEIVIALFVFSIGILGLSTMQLTSLKGNSKAARITEASNSAADQIETFMILDYTDAELNDDDGDGTDQDADMDGVDDDGGNFGLDDLESPDGQKDRDNDGVDDVFWNVAIDHPTQNTKTIKIFVDPIGGGKVVSMVIIKANIEN